MFSVVAGPPKVALTPVELTPPWPPLEAWPQQKTQLFGNSEGLPAIRAKSSSQKTLIPISPKFWNTLVTMPAIEVECYVVTVRRLNGPNTLSAVGILEAGRSRLSG